MIVSFSPPDMTELELQGISEVLQSGWITTGPRTKQFEQEVAGYCGTEQAVCLNSATAALELTLHVLGIGSGDEVITSAYTYTASASPAVHVGATVRLVDVAQGSFEMDYEALEKAITEKTKVIVPVDIGGVLCDYERIFDIVERKKSLFCPCNSIQEALGRIAVVADSAHAFGAVSNGKKAGAIADFTTFSFHAVKNLTTAEGGAVTWRNLPEIGNDWIYRQFQLLSLHGQSKDALQKTTLGAWEYDVLTPAYKCNMTDIMAAIGLKQLERYDEMVKRRHEILRRYDEEFHALGIKTLCHKDERSISSGHLYITRVPKIESPERNIIIGQMAEHGISCNVHYKPLPMMTAYKALGFDMKDYPNAYGQFQNEITLPLHTRLTDEEVEYVISHYVKTVKGHL